MQAFPEYKFLGFPLCLPVTYTPDTFNGFGHGHYHSNEDQCAPLSEYRRIIKQEVKTMVDESKLNWYIVGGAVRDELLGKEPNDYDHVVVGSNSEEMNELGFNNSVGESFAVFIHPETGEEWALARIEESTGEGDKEFNIIADESASLEEDLARRDLTINAMAKDPDTGEIIDPHGGQRDIENKTLRHVSEAFVEDPLRVIRVATFRARMPEFTVAPETKTLCRELTDQLESLAPQRVHREMIKAFEKSEQPRLFFDTLRELDALKTLFPTIHEMTDIRAGPEKYHGEGSSYEHTMCVISEAHNIDPNNDRLLLAALGHDLGKIKTDEDKLPSHPKHTDTGTNVVEDMSERLKLENEHEAVMKDAVRNHMRIHNVDEFNDSTLVRFVDEVKGGKGLTVTELLDLAKADSQGREPPKEENLDKIREKVELAEEAIESINGYDIMQQFDVEQSEGKKIRDLLIQQRTEKYRELK